MKFCLGADGRLRVQVGKPHAPATPTRRLGTLLERVTAIPSRVAAAICGLAQLAAPVAPGGPSSTVGTYSNSWSPPSKVRLSTRSSLMSGYPS